MDQSANNHRSTNNSVEVEILSKKQMRFWAYGESLLFEGSLLDFVSDRPLSLVCSHTDAPFLIFTAEMTATDETFLSEIRWLNGRFEEGAEHVIQSTELSDSFLFIRKNRVTFLFSLDFPYSKIQGGQISYEPYTRIEKSQKYIPHSLTVTACRQNATFSGLLDTTEIEAASDYVENRFPVRFDRPMNLSTVITNRMTYVRENRIFYSMYDNPTLTLDPETIFSEIDLCEELGIEYYQVFEGVFDWVDVENTSKMLKKLVEYASRKGIKVGDYVHPGEMYCPHYNYEGRSCGESDWRIQKVDGTSGQLCLGCDEYLHYLKERLIRHNREHKEKMICLDMLHIVPCYNEKHRHPPGDVYKQVLGLVDLMESLNQLSGDYLCWTNSGNWIEFMPKLVWVNQNIYLTDPHPGDYMPALNTLKYLGDCRREQMVHVHEKYLVPYRFFSNCEYYHAPRSRISDIRVYEYSLLQSLAVTPNICFAELRTFIERIPSKEVAAYKAFVKKWLRFIRENYLYWKKTMRCKDMPGPGATEVYSHIIHDQGFLCLVNQNTYSIRTQITLDQSIGLSGGDRLELSEIYPEEYLLWETGVPYSNYGDRVDLNIPPESVRYIRISPYAERSGTVVYGAKNRIENTESGIRVFLREDQGTKRRIVIAPEKGKCVVSVSVYQVPTVKMFTFDARAEVVETISNGTIVDVIFPLSAAPGAITAWTREADNRELILPVKEFGFLGALISGSYSEKFQVCVEVLVSEDQTQSPQQESYKSETSCSNSTVTIPHHKKERLFTKFVMPFIEPMHFASKSGYPDDCVMHLVFEDPGLVSKCKVWLNDTEVDVMKYRNAAKRDWFSYYIELTGQIDPGTVNMTLEIEWTGQTNPGEKEI